MTYRTIVRHASRVGVAIAASFLLSGCLDIAFDISLKGNGTGSIAVGTTFGPQLTELMKDDKTDTSDTFLAKYNKDAVISEDIVNNRLTRTETIDFKALSDVTLAGSSLEVSDLGQTAEGRYRQHIRFVPDADKDDEESDQDSKKTAAIFKGYFFSTTIHVPCTVTEATPKAVGDTPIEARIENGTGGGATVSWKIPLDLLILNGGDLPTFDIDCVCAKPMPPGVTKMASTDE